MSRTYHATGTGSFTRAFEVRADRSALRQYNQNPANRMNQELEPMHGATRTNREGTITYEEAQQIIKNGDKIKTPDGILHKVTAENRDELIGRLGATLERPAKDFGRAAKGGNVQRRGSVEVFRGNLSNPKSTKAKIGKDGKVIGEKRGQKGAAQRTANTPIARNIAQVLPTGILEGIGRGSSLGRAGRKDGTGEFGFKPQVGPVSTYKPSPNSKNTQIKTGRAESKGNTKLNTRAGKVGGFLPRSSKSIVGSARSAKIKQNAKDRAANKAAGVKSTPRKRGPSSSPAGTKRSTTVIPPRKGGRSGQGRSK